jgi:chaperonin GroEL (HSP60 family)
MDQQIGVEIIERALRAPISTIVKNAGREGAVVLREVVIQCVSPQEKNKISQER